MTKARDAAILRIETSEARVARADPELPATVEVQRAHAREPAIRRVTRADRKRFEFSGERILPQNAAAIGGQPESTAGVACDMGYETIGKAAIRAVFVRLVAEWVAVEAIEAIFSAHPQEARCILRDRIHRELREAAVAIESVYIDRQRRGGPTGCNRE
jgi:hypothetical protein